MERIIPQIAMTLREAKSAKEEVEGVAVGIGPGSFTGLRIGVTIARTFAQLMGVPIVGVPSLDAIARHLGVFEGAVCPAIDAKRGEVYTAVYDGKNEGAVSRLSDFRPLSPELLSHELRNAGYEKVLLAGDGVAVYHEVFKERLGDRAVFAPPDSWWPRASDLAFLAASRFLEDNTDDLYSLVPIYARLSQAEEMWLKRRERA